MKSTFTLTRENGQKVSNKPTEMADYVAALGVESVSAEIEINGEKVVVGFEFDPPLVPKVPA